MASPFPLHLMLISFSLFSIFTLLINPSIGSSLAEKHRIKLQNLSFKDGSRPICSPQRPRKEKGELLLELKHHGRCSKPTLNWHEEMQKLLFSDTSRVQTLQALVRTETLETGSLSETRITLVSGIKLNSLNYIVTIGIGNEEKVVLVDTGSDLTWVQCKPCKSCYEQQDAIFDPSLSPTYNPISCNSSECLDYENTLGNFHSCPLNQTTCAYLVTYGDGSYTRGSLGHEKLSLGVDQDDWFKGFVFGCGLDNHGLFGKASGLIGLGRSPISLISQTTSKFGGVFSYCLPSPISSDSSGWLSFGQGAIGTANSSEATAYTSLLSKPGISTFYFCNLTGISIGGVLIEVNYSSNGQVGSLIDSGTVISRLFPSVYKAVKAEFLKQTFGLPSAPKFSILDTCFNLSGYEEVSVPTLRFHFEGGAEINVDESGILYVAERDNSQVCLALASLGSEEEYMILGNFQQQNVRVVYDTKGDRLGFASQVCSEM
ncbi:hypothetical protein AMTRI_Chr12g273550 [Amborella trichopoda]|uniref:Peptidase A1 domain-containing protein n=1 Tax=Amborella trichopoda TaxID=13333 RepID=W1PHG7_AMBTC|nr:aspartyl protease family protein At5g10770 [Amborella trichopoda]ERN07071.1 hypothetical protein AMTR_s00019p00061190 [Amborella trichopoda]|eukprot:XP_011623907.2 aspartyl protease family protein At5g10770 [Amborella trichopoda]